LHGSGFTLYCRAYQMNCALRVENHEEYHEQ